MEWEIYQLSKFAAHLKNGKERFTSKVVYLMLFPLFSQRFSIRNQWLKKHQLRFQTRPFVKCYQTWSIILQGTRKWSLLLDIFMFILGEKRYDHFAFSQGRIENLGMHLSRREKSARKVSWTIHHHISICRFFLSIDHCQKWMIAKIPEIH